MWHKKKYSRNASFLSSLVIFHCTLFVKNETDFDCSQGAQPQFTFEAHHNVSKVDAWRLSRYWPRQHRHDEESDCKRTDETLLIMSPILFQQYSKCVSRSLSIIKELDQIFPSLQMNEHHHILYDLRTVLGPRHANYMEIGSRSDSSLSVILQHPFRTSIFAVNPFSTNQYAPSSVIAHFNSRNHSIQLHNSSGDDQQFIRELHEDEFGADILFIDGDHRMDCVARDFYNYHEFVLPGGFLVFNDYSEDPSSGDVPAFVDEMVSKLKIHDWSYFDVWGAFPQLPQHRSGGGAGVFVLRRQPDHGRTSPLLSEFSRRFRGRRWDQLMGLSRTSRPAPAAPAGNAPIHFAVLMSFFRREFDPHFVIPAATSLPSLATQTFRRWTLVAVGDGLAPADVEALLGALRAAGMPLDQVRIENLDPRFREERIYRNHDGKFEWRFGSEAAAGATGRGHAPAGRLGVWKCAGTNALNLGLDLAEGVAGATHVARLDEDDVWGADHLRNLAEAYEWARGRLGRRADFAYTQGRDIGGQRFFPSFNAST